MKKIILSLLVTLIACAARAQYSIDWYKVSGGGGTSTGGVYAVTGTIGQPDAGAAMTGGSFSLTGGFWGLIATVQTPGSPTLAITHSGNSVILSWPYPSTGYALQQNNNLGTTNWTASGLSVTNNGSINTVTITAPTGKLFFRLASP